MPRGFRAGAGTPAKTVLIVALLVGVAAGGVGAAHQRTSGEVPQPPDLVQAAPAQDVTPLPEPATPEPTPTPAPTPAPIPEPIPAPPPPPYLDTHRVVAYYGHPLTPLMGIVGEYEPAELIRRLRAQSAVYQDLSPDREITPALELVYGVAQAGPGADGLYLVRMDDALVRQWIDIARDNGLLVFLDIQFGRSNVERELPRVLPYLAEPHVHLALDPEFAWGPNQVPSRDIGHLDGADINRAQEILSNFIADNHLPDKILIVHQFRLDMITNKPAVHPFEGVELVFNADGFGAPATKLATWNAVIVNDGVERAGIKLFYKQDARSGRLMSEADVMGLQPVPVFVVYQ